MLVQLFFWYLPTVGVVRVAKVVRDMGVIKVDEDYSEVNITKNEA